MPPSVAFTQPGELFSAIEPPLVIHHVDPGRIVVEEHPSRSAGTRIAEDNLVGVLQPIEPLNRDGLRIASPFHPCEIVVSRISRNLEPDRRAPGGAHNPDARG